jgi:putative acetyltransferase
MRIRAAADADFDTLIEIWLRSVRATHKFLSEDAIQALLPDVRNLALPNLELWVLCSDASQPIGFMGLAEGSIEALFLAPEHAGQGGGRMLVEHARRLKGRLRVDVNEQNPEALGFYLGQGFEVVGRSPTDAAGRPFPLLHLQEAQPAPRSDGE